MRSRGGKTKLALGAILAVAVCALTASAGTGLAASATSFVPRAGTGSPQTGNFTPSGAGDVTQAEFAGEMDSEEGPEGFDGNNRRPEPVGRTRPRPDRAAPL